MRIALIIHALPFFYMPPDPADKPLFTNDPLADLAMLIGAAGNLGARRLLLLAGKYPVSRIGCDLSPPMVHQKLHFEQTHSLARALLSDEQLGELDAEGSVETEWELNERRFPINVFFGDGSHNVIVFLEE